MAVHHLLQLSVLTVCLYLLEFIQWLSKIQTGKPYFCCLSVEFWLGFFFVWFFFSLRHFTSAFNALQWLFFIQRLTSRWLTGWPEMANEIFLWQQNWVFHLLGPGSCCQTTYCYFVSWFFNVAGHTCRSAYGKRRNILPLVVGIFALGFQNAFFENVVRASVFRVYCNLTRLFEY